MPQMVGQLPYLLITFPRSWFLVLAQNIRKAHTLQIACTVNTNSISSVSEQTVLPGFIFAIYGIWELGQ